LPAPCPQRRDDEGDRAAKGTVLSVIPEPMTLSLLAIGALALIRRRRR